MGSGRMTDYQLRMGEGVLQVPGWWFDALLIWLAVMGLIIFLFGRRLVRPALAAVGLVSGVAMMLSMIQPLIHQQWPEASPVPFAFLGGLVGALAAFVLWRLGVGAMMCLTVAIITPAVFIVAFGLQGPDIGTPLAQAGGQLKTVLEESSQPGADPRELPQLLEPIQAGRQGVIDACAAWWDGLTTPTKWMLGSLTVGGALVALLLGFALPVFSATFVTALFGTLFMVGLLYRINYLAGDSLSMALPSSPRTLLLFVAAVSLVGFLIQTLFLRDRRAEKT